MALSKSYPLVFMQWCRSLFSMLNRAELSNQWDIADMLEYDFQGLSHKRHCGFCLTFISITLGKDCPNIGCLSTFIERFTQQGTKVSYKQLTWTCLPCDWAILKADPPAPVTPSDDSASLTYHCNFTRGPRLEAPSLVTPKLLPIEPCEGINFYSFKLLSFGVICYVSIDNKYTM